MIKKQKFDVKSLINPNSLKSRLTIVLIISSLIPLILIGLVSLYTITYEMKSKVEGAIQSNLMQVRINVENSLNNLDYVSRQLAFSGTIAEKFLTYIEGDDIFDKYLLNEDIRESMSLISNTSPNIGVILYFSTKNDEVLFTNNTIIRDFNLGKLNLFSQGKDDRYFGPSPSVNNAINSKVFSIVRKMDNYLLNDYYVYIETDNRIIDKLLRTDQYSIKASHILIDCNDKIVYNSGNSDFIIGEKIEVSRDEKSVQHKNNYYYFNEISQQGWNVFAVIKNEDINSAANQWLFTYIVIFGLSLCISLIFAVQIWRMIYKPMKSIKKEILLVSENNYDTKFKFTNVLEFDELLNKLYYMKLKVHDLLIEVEMKEKTKRYLEVEKLMHQINPHFLHNTLNNVQWLARENGQIEIARIIALLTKVLHYNMGKEGVAVTIGQEIDAVRSYVELQRIRYDKKFDVEFNIDEDILDAEIPRFVLQPLVENALYHGINCGEGLIGVKAIRWADRIKITIADNGIGMDESEIKKCLGEDYVKDKEVGLGIGIRYVKNMLKVSYGKDSIIDIHSRPGNTEFIIEIPYKRFS